MSYTIEYDKVFLRSASGYTPLWLAGDSNCYEGIGRHEHRARRWSVFQNLLGVTEAQILESIQPMLGGPYQQHWKRRGKWVDDKGMVAWVKNGCKNAVSVEDLVLVNGTAFACRVMTENYRVLSAVYISTTAELDAWLADARKTLDENKGAYPEIRLNSGKPIRHPPQAKSSNALVVIKSGNRFVSEYTDNSITACRDRAKALIFSMEDAQKILVQYSGCRIVSADVLDNPCNMGVEITDKWGEKHYLVGFPGPYKVRYTSQLRAAKRYSSKSAAEKAAKTAKQRYPDWDYAVVELPEANP